MNELVSIIMPAYNAARHIAESIDSVLAQTYPAWELVVVDDGSTDDTRQVVAGYRARDERIRYVYQDNARQGRARNNGIAHAAGAYVAFLDSDDLWVPHKLAVQVQALEQHRADLVFADAHVFADRFDPAAATAGTLPTLHTGRGVFAGDEGLRLFLEGNRIPILTVLTRRSVLDAVGGFTENPLVQNAEDYHLWLKLLLAGFGLVGADLTLAAYRRHASSVSGSDGQNLKQAVEAKVDLAAAYPAKREPIAASVRRTIVLSLEEVSKYRTSDLFATIDRYLVVAGKPAFRPLFGALRRAGARRLALKSIYFVFNHL